MKYSETILVFTSGHKWESVTNTGTTRILKTLKIPLRVLRLLKFLKMKKYNLEVS